MAIRVLLLRWMTAIKVPTDTGTLMRPMPFYHTNTHCSYATVATGFRFPLASLGALIKLVLASYYGCIAWHRLMWVTRHGTRRTPFAPPTFHLAPAFTCFYVPVALSPRWNCSAARALSIYVSERLIKISSHGNGTSKSKLSLWLTSLQLRRTQGAADHSSQIYVIIIFFISSSDKAATGK